ncbi:hypothetical protein RHSIM_Rhsim03G0041100 [Rhododendron simsii]|uniref:Uncharacterized protein n=1 Tax=Rhododendron simsii TaxID=118357 RepID=A0A834LTY3_RHOSS|nr:hypothetical protein RHSIM_Rhsim03G0041100 [Rhododendron simsii]
MVAAHTSNYLLLAIIVVATASVAQATVIISGVNVSGVIVTGVYVQPAGLTIIGVRVNISLSCDGGATTIGTQATIIGRIGVFKVATTTGIGLNGTLFDQSRCAVYAYAPIPNLPANASAIASASLRGLQVLEGVQLVVQNGQINIIPNLGSSIGIYSTATFSPASESLIGDKKLTISRFPAPKSAGIALVLSLSLSAPKSTVDFSIFWGLSSILDIMNLNALTTVLVMLAMNLVSSVINIEISHNDLYLLFVLLQGGCRTGMVNVTNAYDLPARSIQPIRCLLGVLVFLAAKFGIIKDAEEAAEFQDFIICAENGRKQRK